MEEFNDRIVVIVDAKDSTMFDSSIDRVSDAINLVVDEKMCE